MTIFEWAQKHDGLRSGIASLVNTFDKDNVVEALAAMTVADFQAMGLDLATATFWKNRTAKYLAFKNAIKNMTNEV